MGMITTVIDTIIRPRLRFRRRPQVYAYGDRGSATQGGVYGDVKGDGDAIGGDGGVWLH